MNRRTVAGIVILAILLSGCGSSATPAPLTTVPTTTQASPSVSVKGEVNPAVWATLSTQAGGTVKEIRVKTGDEVTPGDLLLQLDPADAQLAVLQAEAAVKSAQAQLDSLKAGPRSEEINVAEAHVKAAQSVISQTIAQRDQLWSGATQADIAAAEAEVTKARAEQRIAWDQHEQTMQCRTIHLPDGSKDEVCPALGTLEEQARFKLQAADDALAAAQARLEAVKGGSYRSYRAADAAVLAAESQRDVAQAELDLLKAGTTTSEVAIAEATLSQAQASLEVARVALERCELRAPFAGTIGAIKVRAGEPVTPGQPLVILGDLATLQVETTNVDDVDVARIVAGQTASVTFDALAGQDFTGRISSVAPMAEPDHLGGFNYAVIIELDNLSPAVRWGMKASVAIEVE